MLSTYPSTLLSVRQNGHLTVLSVKSSASRLGLFSQVTMQAPNLANRVFKSGIRRKISACAVFHLSLKSDNIIKFSVHYLDAWTHA